MVGRIAVEQVEMGQRIGKRGAGCHRVAAFVAGLGKEGVHLFGGEIGHGGTRAGRRVEWTGANVALAGQPIHQARVETGGEFRYRRNATADNLVTGFANEGLHLGMPRCIGADDEYTPVFTGGGGAVEFVFCWRNTRCVLKPVFLAEKADVERAAVNLGKIDLISPLAGGGDVLKQEDLEKLRQQWIVMDVIFERTPFRLKFLLDRTEEDNRAGGGGGHDDGRAGGGDRADDRGATGDDQDKITGPSLRCASKLVRV